MLLKIVQWLILIFYVLLLNSCIAEFIPRIEDEKELLVVEGLITDQSGPNTIKLSTSLPLGEKSNAKPLTGCTVSISDDKGGNFNLEETIGGTYVTPPYFKGIVGTVYTLHIKTNNSNNNNRTYRSIPVKMKPVPAIDSLYYEKKVIRESFEYDEGIQECQIYLDTHDPENSCKYYRWDYFETWVLRLNFDVPNQKCWINEKSLNIYVESTAAFGEDRIKRHPVTYISNATDRLKTKYSILVNQYSLNEDEYIYWVKLQKLTEQVGGLYDIIPASIPSNMTCIENPGEKVLGYFSVSAISSKRIYIKDKFAGIIDPYARCISDTIIGQEIIPDLGVSVWTLFDTPAVAFVSPRIRILTTTRGCADCTMRGSTTRPLFWIDDN